VFEELGPQFERLSGHKLVFTWGEAARLKTQIEKGTDFDICILAVSGIDDLIKQGKIAAATRTPLARSGIGVAVRKGAPKPDISTTEAFKRALLNATSIGYAVRPAST
jgi:molybdate transport system substrate-binding protein